MSKFPVSTSLLKVLLAQNEAALHGQRARPYGEPYNERRPDRLSYMELRRQTEVLRARLAEREPPPPVDELPPDEPG